MMVGHYSTPSLASASFVNNVFNVALFACMGFSYGLTPIIGAMYARGDSKRIGNALRAAIRINLLFTLAVCALMAVLYFNLHRLGQPPELLPIIRPYFLIVLAGMIPATLFNVLAQTSFGIGDTGMPTWIILSTNAVNVVGNYMLIFGNWGCPELGLTGAGLATLAARVLSLVVIVLIFVYRRPFRKYHEGFCQKISDRPLDRKIALTGFPVAMQMTFETAAFSGSAVIAGWIDAISLAALQIVVVSGMLGFCIYYSIAGAMAIDVSHAAGEGNNAEMRRSALAGYILVLSSMACTCILFLTMGRQLMALFTDDPVVLSLAVSVIVPMVLYQFGDATQISFANALRGTSKVMPMLYIAFFSYVIIGLPLTYLMAITAKMGLYGIVLSFSGSLMTAAALYLYFFLRATRPQSKA